MTAKPSATHSDGGSTHGRFMFPAIGSTATFLLLGLWALPKALRLGAVATLLATCLAVIGYSVDVLPRSFGPTLPVYGDMHSASAQHSGRIRFANGMNVLGWSELDRTAARPGEVLHLRLFWEGSQQPDFDYSAYVRLDNGAGRIIHDQDHGPGTGIGLLPHEWQPGEVVPDDWAIQLPADALPGEYDIVVGLYDYRDMGAVYIPDRINSRSGVPETSSVLGRIRLAGR
jgi:hypothetical protein